MTNVDAPDWYRQALSQSYLVLGKTALANGVNNFTSLPAGSVPPGYRSLVMLLDGANHATEVIVEGQASGFPIETFIGINSQPIGSGYFGMPYISELDPQLTVVATCSSAGGHIALYALPEAVQSLAPYVGIFGNVNPAYIAQVGGQSPVTGQIAPFILSGSGSQYVVPCPPDGTGNNTPPNDLTTVSVATATAGATLVAAPGAGNRLRVYRIHATPAGVPAATYTVAVDGIEGQTVPLALATAGGVLLGTCLYEAKPSGQPTPTNTALTNHATLSNTWTFTVTYTEEAA